MFSDEVRQELARGLPDARCDRTAILTALVMLAGSLHLRAGGVLRLEIATSSGAVARAAFTLLQEHVVEGRPELVVQAPGGLRRASSYVVALEDGARHVATSLGVLDGDGRPTRPSPDLTARCDLVGFARGALMAGGSFSAPGRDPHLEIPAPTAELAAAVARSVAAVTDQRPTTSRSGERWRVVLKSGAAIGDLLSGLGATRAFLAWDESRLRRSLRGAATRLANADAANLRRSVEAAAQQARVVERAIAVVGWDGLDEDLRQVALARLANPEATIAELGALCDPPVGKSAVHRRLRRLEAMAEDAAH